MIDQSQKGGKAPDPLQSDLGRTDDVPDIVAGPQGGPAGKPGGEQPQM